MHHRRTSIVTLMAIVIALIASCEQAPRSTSILDQDRVSADVLLEADREFALEVAERGLEAWVDWVGDEGLQLAPGEVVRGKNAIRAYMEPAFASQGFLLEWEPEHASISASGDLGYTYGRYAMHGKTEDGTDLVREGRYVSIWQKDDDGSWKVALDTGVPDPPQAP